MSRKSLLLIFALFMGLSSLFAQEQKQLALVEEFTNTSCGPCAGFAPYLDAALRKSADKCVAIKYHVSFPDPADKFYRCDPQNFDARRFYYNVNGVPSWYVNGVKRNAERDEAKLTSYINYGYKENKPVKIDGLINIKDHKLTVSVNLTALEEINDEKMHLFVVPIEEEVNWTTPARNGEKDFYFCARKILPDGQGASLSGKLFKGQPYTYEVDWAIKNYANEQQLGVVVFVQDDTNKKVVGCTYFPYPHNEADAARILEVKGLPDDICTPNLTATVSFCNQGKNHLKSATINVSVNGKTQQTPWTGDLDVSQQTTITTPAFTDFELNEKTYENKVAIWLSDLNGSSEVTPKYELIFKSAPTANNAVRLNFVTDNKPEESSWKLFNSSGDLVQESEPMTEKQKNYKTNLKLERDDCYSIEFYDKGKDGISTGYFRLDEISADGKSRRIKQERYTGEIFITHFLLKNCGTVGIQVTEITDDAQVVLTSLDGKLVRTMSYGTFRTLDRKTLPPGVYVVKIKSGDEELTQKISITR